MPSSLAHANYDALGNQLPPGESIKLLTPQLLIAPTAAILAALSTVYTLNTCPSLKFVSDGTRLIPLNSVIAQQNGSSSSMLATLVGVTFGKFGLPYDIKIPKNTLALNGRSSIKIEWWGVKNTAVAAANLTCWLGPNNDTTDLAISVVNASGANPFKQTVDSTIGTDGRINSSNVHAVSTAPSCNWTSIAGFDPTVDNYVNFGITGANTGDTFYYVGCRVSVFP